MKLLGGYSKQEKSWMMYDWANSVHSVIVVTILPIFYGTLVNEGTEAMARWGTSTSLAMLIIAVLAPILGALGDFKHWRKRLFTGFVILGATACGAMAIVPSVPESANVETLGLILLILYIISTIVFAGSNLYYDSFLPEITTEERMDRVSIMGFGLGYIGGSTIPLLIFLLMNMMGVAMNVCLSFAFGLACVWWIVFTIPMWENVHQTHYIERERGFLRDSLKNLGMTARRIAGNKTMLFFLIAYFFYIDGVGTVIHMSTIYGSALGIDSTQMMLALLVVQMLGLPFALVYTKLAAKYGARRMVGVAICVYMGICVYGFFVRTAWQFWMLAILVSTSQGGIQALSRSVFGKMIPEKERSGEFFGFYDVFGRFSAIMGPALFGWVAAITGEAPYGVLAVLLIFLIGAALYFVALPRAERKAR